MMVVIAQQWEINSWKLHQHHQHGDVICMIPGIRSHNAAHQTFFFYRCWKCPPPSFLQRFPKTKKELEEQEQEDTRRTWTTHRNNIYQDRQMHCGAPPPAPRTRLFFRPFPCCLDNDTKQAEPQPQPLSQQQQETCRGIVPTFAPLRNSNTNKKKKKTQNDKKKQEETGRR